MQKFGEARAEEGGFGKAVFLGGSKMVSGHSSLLALASLLQCRKPVETPTLPAIMPASVYEACGSERQYVSMCRRIQMNQCIIKYMHACLCL